MSNRTPKNKDNRSKRAPREPSRRADRPEKKFASPERRAAAPPAAGERGAIARRVSGIVFLLVSAAAALALAVEHLFGLTLPGCGANSPCAQLASSVWGRVPGLNWPVSFVGAAYSVAMLAAWVRIRGGVPQSLRNLARLGALASLGFLAAMLYEGHVCWYCIAAHTGNLAFWILVERAPRGANSGRAALTTVGGAFVLATALLGAAKWQTQVHAAAKAEQVFVEIDSKRIEQHSVSTPPVSTRGAEPSEPADPPAAARKPFTGRYRRGPEQAPIRIVMFTGYQCPDCQRIERELEALLKERADVSLSIKQFPMNSDCNKYFKERHHGNACYAARAAEAAGILYGNEGFWKFHRWLFEREGKFENRQILENGLKSLGLDPAGFVAAMEGPETLKRVQEDIEEAVELGIHYTPMIFINGLELRGWNAANAVRRAVEKWAEKNPPPAGPESDQPQPAAAKYVADWREQPQRRIPPRQRSYARGPSDAKVRIVLFGDYDYDMTSKLDAEIRATTKDRDDVLYEFRQAPWNKDCNADVPGNEHAQACRMAQAAEAAGALGGAEGYWRMHAWLLDHQGRYSDERLRAAAQELGFDPAALMSAMDSPEVAAAIADDVRAWKQLRLNAVPALLVNEKFVPRWSREGERIVEQILADAGGK